jgi:hypothetical protein
VGTADLQIDTSGYIEIIGTDQDDSFDLSNESDSHYVELGQGSDVVIGTPSDDWFSLEGGGFLDSIDGGAGADVAEIVLRDVEGRELKIALNEELNVYTVSDINSDGSENVIFNVGGFGALDIDRDGTLETDEFGIESTSYGQEVYGLGNAMLTDIELIVISYGSDSNNEPLQEVIELVGTPTLEG